MQKTLFRWNWFLFGLQRAFVIGVIRRAFQRIVTTLLWLDMHGMIAWFPLDIMRESIWKVNCAHFMFKCSCLCLICSERCTHARLCSHEQDVLLLSEIFFFSGVVVCFNSHLIKISKFHCALDKIICKTQPKNSYWIHLKFFLVYSESCIKIWYVNVSAENAME